MKKFIKYLIPVFVFFIGFRVYAYETLFVGNGVVLNRCTSNICAYPYSGTTNYRAVLNPMSFNVDETYTFNLNFSATTGVASPNLTDCGLNINGSYVSPQSRNSGRTSYECNSGYTRCDSAYVSTITWTATSNMSDVPVFIQCDMTPQSTTYTQTRFNATISSSNGSINQTMLDVGNSIIETNNYNANQNNANRDANSQMIGGKIDSNGNLITNAINTLKSALETAINGVTSAINTGVNVIKDKIGEMIGTQEVCQTFYQTAGNDIIVGDSFTYGRLDTSTGEIIGTNSISFATSPFLFTNRESIKYTTNVVDSGTYSNICFYYADKTFGNCFSLNDNTKDFNYPSYTYFRYSFRTNRGYTTKVVGDCHKTGLASIFNKLGKFFDTDVGSANTGFNGLSNGFQNDNFGGLNTVITAPMNFVNNMNSTCSPINLTIPRSNQSIQIPCLRGYITGISNNSDWQTLINIIVVVINGIICYRVCTSMFMFFHNLRDPNSDDLEVMDL